VTVDAVLVTGAAGFVGFHLARRLSEQGRPVLGLDNISDYYNPRLKEDRIAYLSRYPDFRFFRIDVSDRAAVADFFTKHRFSRVVHLAAQAGVRYSLVNPHAYVDANLQGFLNILEGCRHRGCDHLVFASSSSVYGANTRLPFSVRDNVDHPVSLYAASKKANELMAHSYSHLYGLPVTGLRFFTVYGPWGRPDMAMFIFADAIIQQKPLKLFNFGKMKRDFTFVDDVIEVLVRLIERPPAPNPDWSPDLPDPSVSSAPYRIYNVGNNSPVEVTRVVDLLEAKLGRKAIRELVPIQPGDVPATYAEVDDLIRDFGFKPETPIEVGIERFVEWYRGYNGHTR
jgi:UDP-glucuronate 4-epimerase